MVVGVRVIIRGGLTRVSMSLATIISLPHDHLQVHPADGVAVRLADGDAVRPLYRERLQRRVDCFERRAEVDARAEKHVARDAGERVDVQMLAHGGKCKGAGEGREMFKVQGSVDPARRLRYRRRFFGCEPVWPRSF